MQRKIFIGVALSQAVKKRLMQKVEKWKELPIRWSREENLHLNLISLGHIDDAVIFDICSRINEVTQGIGFFDIDLDAIELSPTNDKEAKLVHFTGKENGKLRELCEEIEKELGIFNANKKIFRPSIVLGRIQRYGWLKLDLIPEIAEKFTVLLPIESVDIFESGLVDGKRKFSTIESCPLRF